MQSIVAYPVKNIYKSVALAIIHKTYNLETQLRNLFKRMCIQTYRAAY